MLASWCSLTKHFTRGITPSSDSRKEILEIAWNGVLNHGGFYLQFIEDTKRLVIDEIRTYFVSNPKTAEYRWVGKISGVNSDELDTSTDCSKILIAHEYNDTVKMLPSILIKDISGRIRDLYLGQKLGTLVVSNPSYKAGSDEPVFLEVGERVGGKLDLTVSVAVRARVPVECDRVTDLLLLGLVGPIRREFYKQNAVWLPDQGSVPNSSVEEETALGKVFVRVVSFGLQVEWYDDFLYQAVTVEAIEAEPIYLRVVQLG